MSTGQASSYDELPYGNNCFPYTHPDHLATLGKLYGIEPPALDRCRVLELGCAAGGNLIPMALALPDARFVGIDLSPRQIDAGREVVEELGLANVELAALNLTDVDGRFGTYDYIICHGVYSWVPEAVREKILAICSERLAPDGIAYVSYNTYPGWHGRGLARDLLAFHVRRTVPALDRVQEARGFLDELVRVLPDQASAYARILRTEGEFLRGVANSYLYHEHLEETNSPCYFYQFVARAGSHGLRYLAEARTPGLTENLPTEAREALDRWADDQTAAEQYLDFLCNRTFRRTLLCHSDRTPLRDPLPDRVPALWVSTNVAPVSAGPVVAGETAEEFRKPEGQASLTTNNPLVKAALVSLYEDRPRAVAFGALVERVGARLGLPGSAFEGAAEVLRNALLRCFLSNLVEFHTRPPRFASGPGERPVASPLARLQARLSDHVTNLRCRDVELTELDRLVLRLLDGDRDRPALIDALVSRVESDDFSVYQGDEPIRDQGLVRQIFQGELEACLDRLASISLLAR